MKTESIIGNLQSEATETQHYHRQLSVGNVSESLQERKADTTQVRLSRKDHVYAVSDDQGSLLEHYRYTAFGEPEIYSPQTQNKLAGSAIANPVLWNSRRYDEQAELYYYKYRHYKTDIGRWLGRDPIEERGGVNLYGFVANEPINSWDLFGWDPKKYTYYKKEIKEGQLRKEIFEAIHKGGLASVIASNTEYKVRVKWSIAKQKKEGVYEQGKFEFGGRVCVKCKGKKKRYTVYANVPTTAKVSNGIWPSDLTACIDGFVTKGLFHNHPLNSTLSPEDKKLARDGRVADFESENPNDLSEKSHLLENLQIPLNTYLGATTNLRKTDLYDPSLHVPNDHNSGSSFYPVLPTRKNRK